MEIRTAIANKHNAGRTTATMHAVVAAHHRIAVWSWRIAVSVGAASLCRISKGVIMTFGGKATDPVSVAESGDSRGI
jgi:hypothetical protein